MAESLGKRRKTLVTVLFVLLLLPVFLTAFQPGEPPVETTVLYDAKLGGTPDDQGFSYIALGITAVQNFVDGTTVLNTSQDLGDQAGYFIRNPLTLDRSAGYTLLLELRIDQEEHLSRHRSGFSVIILSDDLLGLELAFWPDEIWVQEGGSGDTLFTHAEGTGIDTTAGTLLYELSVSGESYVLSAGGEPLLSGILRDYTQFEGFPDPYQTPGLLFLGDNTTRAGAQMALSYVAVQTAAEATETPTATATALPSATATAVATLTLSPTATATPVPSATPTAVATAVPPTKARYPLYLWFSCLKGVDIDVQEK